MKKKYLPIFVLLFLTTGCGYFRGAEKVPETPKPEEIINEVPSGEEVEGGVQINEEGTKYIVNPEKLYVAGPPKDGIPAINEPKFVTVEEANEWIQDSELVLAIDYKGVKRAYPLQIMIWHEIINDVVAGDPLVITYCPLCGSGIAFERTIDGEPVEFGTSGQLYNSNLVMYDRKTDTLWTQATGQAIVGALSGRELTSVSIDTVVWKDWKKTYPDSEVLSKDTGYIRAYGEDPYASYYEDSFLFFPVESRDDSVHPKTVVFGIKVNGKYKAYQESDLKKTPVILDEIDGVSIHIERSENGIITVTNQNTKEEVLKERMFWFSWYAFHPDTQLYKREK